MGRLSDLYISGSAVPIERFCSIYDQSVTLPYLPQIPPVRSIHFVAIETADMLSVVGPENIAFPVAKTFAAPSPYPMHCDVGFALFRGRLFRIPRQIGFSQFRRFSAPRERNLPGGFTPPAILDVNSLPRVRNASV